MDPDKTKKHHLPEHKRDENCIDELFEQLEDLSEFQFLDYEFPTKQYKILPGQREKVRAILDYLIDGKFEHTHTIRYTFFTYTNKEHGNFMILEAQKRLHSIITKNELAEELKNFDPDKGYKKFLAQFDYEAGYEDEEDEEDLDF